MTDENIEISATQLGELSQKWACRRCFWLRSKMKGKLPFQQFPAIFSSIDKFSKELLEIAFRQEKLPEWLIENGEFSKSLPVPGHQRFKALDPKSGVILNGVPDALWVTANGELTIVDFKTSRVSEGELKKWENYVTQLNAYAWIAKKQEHIELPSAIRLALVYTEPLSLKETSEQVSRTDGFILPFRILWAEVEHQPERIETLLPKAKQILSTETPPKGMRNCFECGKVEKMRGLLC